jgi:hypothetical protein
LAIELSQQPKVLLVVDDDELRARYEMVLRLCGFQPVWVSSHAALDQMPDGLHAACVFSDHRPAREAICAQLLALAVPVVRIDPFIRHGREHLPFDVVLPATSPPRRLITALYHLVPNGARPA